MPKEVEPPREHLPSSGYEVPFLALLNHEPGSLLAYWMFPESWVTQDEVTLLVREVHAESAERWTSTHHIREAKGTALLNVPMHDTEYEGLLIRRMNGEDAELVRSSPVRSLRATPLSVSGEKRAAYLYVPPSPDGPPSVLDELHAFAEQAADIDEERLAILNRLTPEARRRTVRDLLHGSRAERTLLAILAPGIAEHLVAEDALPEPAQISQEASRTWLPTAAITSGGTTPRVASPKVATSLPVELPNPPQGDVAPRPEPTNQMPREQGQPPQDSAPVGAVPPFWFNLNAEVIFYGGVAPGSDVWVNGEKTALRHDGTFFYHFKMPDGLHELPIVVRGPGGDATREATLRIVRATESDGVIHASVQPDYLRPLPGKRRSA